MARTLIAESKAPVDWTALHDAVMLIRRRVELFPISFEGPGPQGLGLSIPQRNCNDLAWEELTQLVDVLQKRFHMDVIDLALGLPLGPDTLEAVKQKFLGEESEG